MAWRRMVLLAVFLPALLKPAQAETIALRDGWQVQSACALQAEGPRISTERFRPQGWYRTSVPATVLAVQVHAGVIRQPYFGTNLRAIPGTTYPVGHNFANLPMPEGSPYRCGWWYRREFLVPSAGKGRTWWLRFAGINYRADLWINGRRLADSSQVAGAYRTYEWNVTDAVVYGRPNVLAVEVFAPTEKDLGINWVDWNPCPPDKDMGLWGAVDLVTSGPVALRSPMAVTHFPGASLRRADLTVYAELQNAARRPVHGVVSGTVAGIRIEQAVDLKPEEAKTIVFDPGKYTQLQIKDPQLWWPYPMGGPHLEVLDLKFVTGGRVSDEQRVRFGLREITSELTDQGHRLFRVNGRPLLVRGAGWSPDMLLRQDPDRLREELMLVRDMHLNTIRLEGKLETEDFFRLADEQGILVMLGWCCCDQWEHWDKWTPENYQVAKESLRSQMLRIRSHPSLLVWLNGSDNPPPADVERMYLEVEAQTHWPNPVLSSASARATSVTGPSGVKMTGPYDYVAPSYWYMDKGSHGGAWGFNTETGPGPAIPSLSSLNKFLPAAQLWPPHSPSWDLHNGGGKFRTLDVFNEAMDATYGTPRNVQEYVRIAQTMAYDGERAMFEAYARNKYTSTGVIQWMLNNAWPSNIWHLYDYYLDAGGGYYGTKKACEPLHVQYSYDDHSIVVVNSTYQASPPLRVKATVYDIGLKKLFEQQAGVRVAADASQRAVLVPDSVFSEGSSLYFVDLSLSKESGETISRNFYWVPSTLTRFDWQKTDYTHTPAAQHEDMQALAHLPDARVKAEVQVVSSGGKERIALGLHNVSNALAFQVVATLHDAYGADITPAVWSDNYLALLPGESRVLSIHLPAHVPKDAVVVVSGWNIPKQTLAIR
ncbi:MAG: glycosyl hydrolase family 2 [Acidobacterium ailaaui]|nr:glycosyl hydrolase family 2 [Pseudacidobacterium ailaaui]MCL6463524.1 glycosyl hydrolase family 2 [Pseudacidobacterium ailaaui]